MKRGFAERELVIGRNPIVACCNLLALCRNLLAISRNRGFWLMLKDFASFP